jgi:dTDP-4-dehydrorhamnose 3,5-epimerase
MAELNPSDTIDGVVVVTPDIHRDARGMFIETYRRSWFPGQREMIQGNRGDRQANSVVGLHYHLHQSDYWYVPNGWARVVLHDLRAGGPTDGATLCWISARLTAAPTTTWASTSRRASPTGSQP